jgi:hypothetical protein
VICKVVVGLVSDVVYKPIILMSRVCVAPDFKLLEERYRLRPASRIVAGKPQILTITFSLYLYYRISLSVHVTYAASHAMFEISFLTL